MSKIELTKAEAAFLEFLKQRISKDQDISTTSMAKDLGKSRFWILFLINKLQDKGYIQIINQKRSIILL